MVTGLSFKNESRNRAALFCGIVVLVAIIAISLSAAAEEIPDKARPADATNKMEVSNCHQNFLVHWEQVKKGNLKARFDLLAAMSIPHGPQLLFPSPSYDYLTRLRYVMILAVHSVGPDFRQEENEFIDNLYQHVPELGPASPFGKCTQAERSQKCVDAAVEDGIIPPLTSFAKEIDLYIDAGYEARCPGSYPHEK
jgi:hypothetical protein